MTAGVAFLAFAALLLGALASLLLGSWAPIVWTVAWIMALSAAIGLGLVTAALVDRGKRR